MMGIETRKVKASADGSSCYVYYYPRALSRLNKDADDPYLPGLARIGQITT